MICSTLHLIHSVLFDSYIPILANSIHPLPTCSKLSSGSVEAKYDISKDSPFLFRYFIIEEIDSIFTIIKETSDSMFEIKYMLNISKRNLNEDNFLAAFVQCWWLIEKYVELARQKLLDSFEIEQDEGGNIFSKELIKDNPSTWTASLNMQLLVLTKQIDQKDFRDMNVIRSFRNTILHSDRGDNKKSISETYFKKLSKYANLSYTIVNKLFKEFFI